MSIATEKQAKRSDLNTILTTREGDGSNLTPTQAAAINNLQADLTAEAASNFDSEDARLPEQSVGDGEPYGLRTALENGPVVSSTLTKSATKNSAMSTYTITASKSPTTFRARNLPAGLTLNTANGQITGTPTVDGTFTAYIAADKPGLAAGAEKALVFTIAAS